MAPTATGSSTHGAPTSWAARAASVMPSTHEGDGVPMFTPTADAMRANSPDSWGSWTIAGEAPTAFSTFAATSIETKLVMYCTSGDRSRTAATIVAVVVDGRVTGLLMTAP